MIVFSHMGSGGNSTISGLGTRKGPKKLFSLASKQRHTFKDRISPVKIQVSQGVNIYLGVNEMGFHPSTVSCSRESLSQAPEATYLTRVSSCGL